MSKRSNPIGVCKLCLRKAELQDSHLIPAAVYKYANNPTFANPNPVVVGRRITSSTSRQTKDYLLCLDCEDRFNKHGENEFLKWVWNGSRFPLGDRLAVAHPFYAFQSFTVFSGRDTGIDMGKFGYFALSMVWRGAVHTWRSAFGDPIPILALGSFEEPIRRFLLGIGPYPQSITILVTACTDIQSRLTFMSPSVLGGLGVPGFVVCILGVRIFLFFEPRLHPDLKSLCCVKSPAKLICQSDCSQKLLEAAADIMKTTRITEKTKRMLG